MAKNFIQSRSGDGTAIDAVFTPQTSWEFLSFELEITPRPPRDEDVVLRLIRFGGATVELVRETPALGSIASVYTLRRTAGQLENVRFSAGDTMQVVFANTDSTSWKITMVFTEGDAL
jgi:hypothetical protein